jgi:hypothetical protein
VQIQCDQRSVEVAGEGVVVVAGAGLAGGAEAVLVANDDPVAGCEQGRFLPLPGVAVEQVVVDQDDRRTRSVVFVGDSIGAEFA